MSEEATNNNTVKTWFRNHITVFALIFILLISFLLKTVLLIHDSTVSRDGCYYLILASQWYEKGNWEDVLSIMQDFQMPLLLFMIKNIMKFGISAETAGFGINLVLGAMTPLFAYAIAYELVRDQKVSLFSALLFAVIPSANAFSIEIQRDTLYLFWIGAVMWMLCAGIRKPEALYWMAAGVFLGFSMLTRYESAEFLIIIFASIVILCLYKQFPWKKGLCLLCYSYMSCFVCIIVLCLLMGIHSNSICNFYKDYFGDKEAIFERSFDNMEHIVE